jgi:hypothetical protein
VKNNFFSLSLTVGQNKPEESLVGRLFIKVAFHRSGFSSKQLFIKAAFHQMQSKVAHSSNE